MRLWESLGKIREEVRGDHGSGWPFVNITVPANIIAASSVRGCARCLRASDAEVPSLGDVAWAHCSLCLASSALG